MEGGGRVSSSVVLAGGMFCYGYVGRVGYTHTGVGESGEVLPEGQAAGPYVG